MKIPQNAEAHSGSINAAEILFFAVIIFILNLFIRNSENQSTPQNYM